MERRRLTLVSWICCGLATLVGCNQRADSGGPKAPADAKATPQAAPVSVAVAPSTDEPARTVRQFLQAVKKGNDAEALQWLTPVARQKTQEMQMSVAPPGTETAQFEVGEVEMVEGGAHVASTWSDVDADGNRHAEPIVWILAKENDGWRIAGMATTLFEEKLPIVLNFEDPEEMLQKMQMANAEAQIRRAEAAAEASQAAPVETPPPATTDPATPSPADRMTETAPKEKIGTVDRVAKRATAEFASLERAFLRIKRALANRGPSDGSTSQAIAG